MLRKTPNELLGLLARSNAEECTRMPRMLVIRAGHAARHGDPSLSTPDLTTVNSELLWEMEADSPTKVNTKISRSTRITLITLANNNLVTP